MSYATTGLTGNAAPPPQPLGSLAALAEKNLSNVRSLRERLHGVLARLRGAEPRADAPNAVDLHRPPLIGVLEITDSTIDDVFKLLDEMEGFI